MNKNDSAREIEKALDTLMWVEKHLTSTSEANAALHCNDKVFYSPLATQVHAAVDSLQRLVMEEEK